MTGTQSPPHNVDLPGGAGSAYGSSLPRYSELPRTAEGVGSSWGLFGPDDSLGLLNLLTAERVAAAASLVRSGRIFPLDLPVGAVDPALFQRGTARHTLLSRRPGKSFDDVIDNVYPQAGSQWDALAHIAYQPDRFYNGATADDVRREGRDTIAHWASRGIVTRAVLLDVRAEVAGRGGAGASVPITTDDLEAARQRAGLDYRPADVIMVCTGFQAWYAGQDAETRVRQSRPETLTAAGLDQSEQMVEYLWDSHAMAVVSDTAGLECWPRDRSEASFPFGFLHQILLGQLGMGIGELWALESLADDCAGDSIYEVMLASAPINLPAAGSPANALAVK